jgi:hypothetical protein
VSEEILFCSPTSTQTHVAQLEGLFFMLVIKSNYQNRGAENKPYDYCYSFSSGLGIAHMKDFNLYNESGNKI